MKSFVSSLRDELTKVKLRLIKADETMREEYDFSKGIKNPYAKKLKKITIRIDEDAIEYFKSLSDDLGVSYQSLINLYLRDCAQKQRKLNMSWK
ncbi:BrnA antitoxin family protein [Endozoicomonas sp. ONNA1]|uniref:BrnA antitoxin family protein n=1 Tax=Endozoicomonas sp. ONNA1 TaxID=2828740 RepID=UPI002148DF58|nr:BrnA antitoxin family protein [Endozoicomonas sp. ONNA1]